MGDLRVQVLVPRVVGIFGQHRHGGQAALLPGGAPPVVGQLVPGHSHQPGDRRLGPRDPALPDGDDSRHERLRGQVLGHHRVTTPRQQVTVDLRQRAAIDGRHRLGTG